MIEAYMKATEDVLRLAGQMFLQRIDYELRRFAEDLHDFIYDLDLSSLAWARSWNG